MDMDNRLPIGMDFIPTDCHMNSCDRHFSQQYHSVTNTSYHPFVSKDHGPIMYRIEWNCYDSYVKAVRPCGPKGVKFMILPSISKPKTNGASLRRKRSKRARNSSFSAIFYIPNVNHCSPKLSSGLFLTIVPQNHLLAYFWQSFSKTINSILTIFIFISSQTIFLFI